MALRFLLPPLAAVLLLGAAALAATPPRLARLNLAETELSAQQARNMSELARLLSVLERLRRDPPPALLVSPQEAKDSVRAAILVKAMTPELQRRAEAYARAAAEMGRERRLAAVESAALFTRESQAADAQALPQSPAPGLRGRLAHAAAGGRPAPPARLVTPVAGPVIRRFGQPLPSGGRANGISLAAPRGAAVAAPGAGLVQYVGPVKGWGVILILRLSGGYHLVLAGLDRSATVVGQSVAAGQTVGWMPDARQSSPELYLEVRDQGAPVDPARWLETNAG
ncbi:MAG TPA: peptidoglycan DD-metalloendopeptidase family protein [Phenylobacterium sp.]|uniref:murein hydrolase activator EnvC family protein n=1 Tax=Phenylobacterium sp. TaxID=1871053 RepID=UPI002C00A2CC|nr:peptidoglycan DD-metalloendopeptidase family protein [Phenylobacterium sp.]HSV02850.1 peptidoglycan DD-metalloendopeptidase family protein [Phenylobacterium sp.]